MYVEKSFVESVDKITEYAYLMKIYAPAIAYSANPGQFVNIKVSENTFPLLRRPFSICDVHNDSIFILFDLHGEGTRILSRKRQGDEVDILGPLGNGFVFNDNLETALIVAGGLGSAPFPFLIKKLNETTQIKSFIGGRTKKHLINYQLQNILISTDDGSDGFHGTVLDLLKNELNNINSASATIFACGPNAMLRAVQNFALDRNINCQISVESAMACGFGICQGCPIEKRDGSGYKLICKDGPVFDVREVNL